MTNIQWSIGFLGLVESASWQVADQGDLVVVSEAGGETRYHVRPDDDAWFSLARVSRRADPVTEVWTDDVTVIERCLTVIIGDQIREMARLPMLFIPGDDDDLPSGYRIQPAEDGRTALISDAHPSPVLFANHGDAFPAVQYSHYASADLAELRESMIDPSGHPVFDGLLEARA